MSDSLFEEGGPHRIRRTGHEQYEMSVSLPVDEDGMLGRECPSKTVPQPISKCARERGSRGPNNRILPILSSLG